jgi:hypothetical protein
MKVQIIQDENEKNENAKKINVDIKNLKDDVYSLEEISGFLNLKDKSGDYYYSSFIEKECRKMTNGVNIRNVDVICIYGIGLGYYYIYLKKWLNEDKERELVFIEDDISIIEKFSKTDIAKEILNHKRVKLKYFNNSIELTEVLKQIAWDFPFLNIEVFSSVYNQKKNEKKACFIKEQISFYKNGVDLVFSNYSDHGSLHFENIFKNLYKTRESSSSSCLKGQFKDKPAVICGAGPSLDKNADVIKKLNDKAIIFAGGSSLNALSKHQIEPHFASSLDKQAPYSRFKEHNFWKNPFFIKSSIFHKNFSQIHGEKILFDDSSNHLFESKIFEMMNLTIPQLSSGFTITSFLIEIAKFLGCNPIILVGMDLCYLDDKKYSSNIQKTSKENEVELIKTKDQENRTVYTQKDWLMEKSWIEDFASSNNIEIINATQGGIGFSNIKNMSLEEVLSNKLQRTYDLEGYIHSVICQSEKREIKKENIDEIVDELNVSFKRIKEKISSFFEFMNSIDKKDEFQNKIDQLNFSIKDELSYQIIIEPNWNIWKFSIKKEIENSNDGLTIEEKMKLNKIIFSHDLVDNFTKIIQRIKQDV